MNPDATFYGRVDLQGRLLMERRERIRHDASIVALTGKDVVVTVSERRSLRSGAQNRRYWALLTVGARSLWEDPSEKDNLHEEIAHLLLALPPCEKTGMRRRKRTPKLNTEEFGRYMDDVANKLIELGADLSQWDEEERSMERAA